MGTPGPAVKAGGSLTLQSCSSHRILCCLLCGLVLGSQHVHVLSLQVHKKGKEGGGESAEQRK
jgi:hypothetical protein